MDFVLLSLTDDYYMRFCRQIFSQIFFRYVFKREEEDICQKPIIAVFMILGRQILGPHKY
jgi:hypothetical protein